MQIHLANSLAALTGPWGLAVVFANVLMEQVGFPVPSTPLLIVAGAMSAKHLHWVLKVFLLATATCVLTDIGWFLAGRRYGNRVMRLLCRISLSPDSCMSDTHQRFERWGVKALVIAKFLPGLTVIAVPLAGAQRMPWTQFLSLSAVGSAFWIAAPLLLGALAAPQISALLLRIGQYGGRLVTVAALLLVAYILLKWWQRHRFRAGSADPGSV
jgi:membrane protein DedA with SNARE-associated domain